MRRSSRSASCRWGQLWSTASISRTSPRAALKIVKRTTQDGETRYLARVEITPDLGRQSHAFEFELDPTYLDGIARACAAIVAQMRGSRPDAEARG